MREGWAETTLGEIAEVVGGSTPKTGVTEYWDGDIPWITPTEVAALDGRKAVTTRRKITKAGLASSSARLLPEETVLFTSRATIGAVSIAATPMATNQGFASFICGEEVLPRFLADFLRAHKSDFVARAGGNTFLEISRKNVKAFPIALPPLPEQHRIVDLMGAVDAYVAAADARVEAARTARTALLSSKMSNPGADWRPFEVRDLATANGLVGGPFGSSLVAADYQAEGVPVIRGKNLPDSERFICGEFVFVSIEKAHALKRNTARPGDIVVTQRGTLGQVAIVPQSAYDEYVVSQSQMRLRVEPKIAERDFVYLWLDWEQTRREIDVRKSITANPHINLGIFASLTGLLPPLVTQREIVNVVAPLDEYVLQSHKVADRARDFRSAVLTDLLGGTHEIPLTYDKFIQAA